MKLTSWLFGTVVLGTSAAVAMCAAVPASARPAPARVVRMRPGMAGGLPAGAFLNDVSALRPDAAWAVGYNNAGPLILHWDGSHWSAMRRPNPPGAALNAVSARSPSDAWAVGFRTRTATSKTTLTLMMHWNGKTWTMVKAPDPGKSENYLTAVSVVSAKDAWAVGWYCQVSDCGGDSAPTHGLILHWNGTRWSQVPSPHPCGGQNDLNAVAAVSSTLAWAAGTCYYANGTRPLMLRWNGRSWKTVTTPALGGADNWLNGVSAISPDSAWAVGARILKDGYTQATLTMRWNGKTWRAVPSPNPGLDQNILQSVSAVAATDVWATGTAGTASGQFQILTFRWNGQAWTQVSNTALGQIFFTQISADTTGDAWITAISGDTTCTGPILMRWHNDQWAQTC